METNDQNISWTDTHAHITTDPLTDRAEEIIENARKNGVDKIVNICCDEKALEAGIRLVEKNDYVFLSAATSPHDIEKFNHTFYPQVEKCALENKLIAIGETGLDYYYLHSSKVSQEKAFIKYLELAKEKQLPLVIHCRDAFNDLFKLTDKYFPEVRAILHCFTGEEIDAKKALERGWSISFSGIVTFKKSQRLREIVQLVPLENLFIETDSPYLAPEGKRGQINEPGFLPIIASKVAEEKQISLETLSGELEKNFQKMFFQSS